MEKLNLEEKCFLGDTEFLTKNMLQVNQLILTNPFSERMVFLLNHQELARKKMPAVLGDESEPNCIGTALWVAGVSKLNHPYHGYENELDAHMKVKGDDWEDDFRIHNERKIPGALVFSYSVESDGWHAGVYLGKIQSEDILFAQHGWHEMFGVETSSRCYARPSYYIPATLRSFK